MEWFLPLLFFSGLIVLALIFSERISAADLLDGRWPERLADGIADGWNRLARDLDRALLMVSQHVWWFVAAGSGFAGASIVAVLIFTGLTEEAQAVRDDEKYRLNAGGILDGVDAVESRHRTPFIVAATDTKPPSVYQTVRPEMMRTRFRSDLPIVREPDPLRDRGLTDRPAEGLTDPVRTRRFPWERDVPIERAVPADDRLEIATDPDRIPRMVPRRDSILDDADFPELSPLDPWLDRSREPIPAADPGDFNDFRPGIGPDLDLSFFRLPREVLTSEDSSEQLTRGRMLPPDPAFRSDSDVLLWKLRDDMWKAGLSRGFSDILSGPQGPLAESTALEVIDQEDGIRIVTTDDFASARIQVEKSQAVRTSGGGLTYDIRVFNESASQVSGLLLREYLPESWTVTDMQPRGTYRLATATWLIEPLDPSEQRTFTISVRSDRPGNYAAQTEISTIAATTSPVRVTQDRGERVPLPRDPVAPAADPFPLRPDGEPWRARSGTDRLPQPEAKLRLSIVAPPENVAALRNQTTMLYVANEGNAAARDVVVLVNLPLELDHEDIGPENLNREIRARISEVGPNVERRIRCSVIPTVAGTHIATATLIHEGQILDVQEFRIIAAPPERPPASDLPSPTPDPAGSGSRGSRFPADR